MVSGLKWALVTGMIVVPAIAWTATWSILSQRAVVAIDGWIADERARDRAWACKNREVAGFPFELRIECSSPTLRSASGPVRDASARHLTASASIFSPSRVALNVLAPLTIESFQGAAKLEWAGFEGSLARHGALPEISLLVTQMSVAEAVGAVQSWRSSTAAEIALRVRSAPDRAAEARAMEVMISATNLSAKPADSFVGNDAPLNGALTGIVLNVRAEAAGTFAERLDDWRAGGGRVQLSSLSIRKGPSTIDASGDLTLDELRRLEGRASLRFTGVQAILSGLNLPAAPLAIEGLLRGSARSGGASLIENRTLPLVMRSGRVYVGPVRTPIILQPMI